MFKIVFIFLTLFSMIGNVIAKNYHIQPNGNDANDGLSFAKAFKTIQTATNRVVAGDSVFVYDGFYKGFDHFYKNSGTATEPIVYLAKGNNVVINQSCGRGFDGLNIEGNDYIEVNGFKVSRISDPSGSGEDGIRAVLANHITIRYCEVDSCYRGIFTGYTDDFLAEYNICKRSHGEHGIYVSNNSDRVIVRYNVCFGNSRAAGIQLNPDLSSGAPGISVDVKIYNNICYNNRIGLNLQGIYDSEVYNNLIYDNGLNGGGNGITLFHGDAATGCKNVKVYNNTVFVPSASQWCILGVESDSLFVKNNILVSASPKGCLNIETSCTNYFSDYNILNNKMTTDDGNTYIDFATWQQLGRDKNSILENTNSSLFVNLANKDFHLSKNSNALDAGTSEVSSVVTHDLDGRIRPQNTIFDIGCYESQAITLTKNIKSNERLTIQIRGEFAVVPDCDETTHIQWYNANGVIIGKGNRISISSLPTGVYFAKKWKGNTHLNFSMGSFVHSQ